VSSDLEVIAGYLARRDLPSLDPGEVGRGFDVVVLCGSAVPDTVELAAQALHDGIARQILVTGGFGHSTPYLAETVAAHATWNDVATTGRPEAAVIAEILRRHCGVAADVIATEERATNCGENAELSLRLLPGEGRLLLVQDPTMQRRTHASFEHHQGLLGTAIEVVSQAPLVLDPDATWGRERFVTLLLGEVRRLHDDADGYGPRGAGYIDHVDVPDAVLAAYRRAAQAFPNLRSRRA
jgi:uncharacterized SAM-binding protein YcdF (DUF218 family)